jgi:hypothetical protein
MNESETRAEHIDSALKAPGGAFGSGLFFLKISPGSLDFLEP